MKQYITTVLKSWEEAVESCVAELKEKLQVKEDKMPEVVDMNYKQLQKHAYFVCNLLYQYLDKQSLFFICLYTGILSFKRSEVFVCWTGKHSFLCLLLLFNSLTIFSLLYIKFVVVILQYLVYKKRILASNLHVSQYFKLN